MSSFRTGLVYCTCAQAAGAGAGAGARERFVLAMWLFFALVMCTAYQAVLRSLRAAPQLQDSLKTLEDLAQTDIVVRGPEVVRPSHLYYCPNPRILFKHM